MKMMNSEKRELTQLILYSTDDQKIYKFECRYIFFLL